MALIKCPDCGNEFSDQAPHCPSCGRLNSNIQQQPNVQQTSPNRVPISPNNGYRSNASTPQPVIRDQLVSDYGEQFTKEEADYAIEHLE